MSDPLAIERLFFLHNVYAKLSQLIDVHSRLADEVTTFLTGFANTIDWTPWEFGGKPMRASSAFVEPRILTARETPRAFSTERNASGESFRKEDWREVAPEKEQALSPFSTPPSGESDERQRQEGLHEEVRWNQVIRPGSAQRQILIGEPGGGKTCATRCTMSQLARESARFLATHRADVSEVAIPLWITAAHLLEQPVGPGVAEVVIGALEQQPEMKPYLTAKLRRWLALRVAKPGCALAIDGLDELRETQTPKTEIFSARLRELGSGATSLMVTCRTLPWKKLSSLVPWQEDRRTLELAPLDAEQRRAYGRAFFDYVGQPGLAGSVEEWLKQQPALRRHMRTPLIMTFACGLSLEGHLFARVSLRALYSQVVFSLLEGAWRTKVVQLPVWSGDVIGRERIALFLRELVWPLFLASSGLNRFNLTDWTTAWDRAAATDQAPEINRDQLVRDLCHLGLLVDGGMDEAGHPCWSFAHRTVLEFLVADYLVDGMSSAQKQPLPNATGWRALFGSIAAPVRRWFAKPSPLDWVLYTKCPFLNAPEWQQVLVFLAGMLPQPRRLLEAIQIRIDSGNEDVFRTAYSLQKELLFAMPAGAGGDDFARHLAKKWLERWSTVLAYRDELLEAPEYPRRQPIPDRTLISSRVVHERLLRKGCRIAEQPVAAEEMVGFLTELLQDGKLDQVRRQQLELFQEFDRKIDPESVNFTFAATVEEFHARILETLAELSSHLGSNSAFNRACATLGKVLQSDQQPETLRVTAAARLRKFPTEAAVDALLCGLEKTKEWTIREASAESLGQIGATRAVPALIAALAPDRENGGALRFVSAHALGVIGSEEAIPGLRAALQLRQPEDPQEDRRVERTTALKIETASRELFNRFCDSLVPLRAADALRKINSDKAAIALLETLRANPDADVASQLAFVLSDIKSDRVFEFFRVAADSSNHQPESYRETAIRCLARMQDPRCGPLLRHVLEREPEEPESVRIAAVEALGDLALEEGIAPLSRVLGSLGASGGLREAAAAALGKIGSDGAAQALRLALPCPDDSLLNAIFLALGEIRCPTSLIYFREAIQPIRHVSLRILAAEALGKIGSDAVVDELLDALKPMELGSDGEDNGLEWIRMNRLRNEAAIALGRIGSEKAIPGLLAALSPSRSHRSNADEREFRRFEAIESVRTITRESVHEDWEVRLSAALALRHIGLKCAQREVLGSLVQSLLVILNSNSEDHAGVRIATRESLQAICAEHRLQIPATPQFPSFQDVTIF